MEQLYKIYYSAILAIGLLNIPEYSKATHLMGGEITASVSHCQSYIYDINLVLFWHADSDMDFGHAILYVGHGEAMHLSEEENFSFEEKIDEDSIYRVATFSLRHTFPGPGEYDMYFQDFNREAAVANMHNSVQTPFFTETRLMVDPLLGCNSTPELTTNFPTLAYAKSTFTMPLEPTDVDGDSLSFEWITPMQDVDKQVEGYRLPHVFDMRFAPQPTSASGEEAPSLFINPQNTLVWDAPNLGGTFALALRVNEWRKVEGEWNKIGYITRDITVFVMDTLNNTLANDYITSGQEEVTQPKVNMYPNPTTGEFTLEVNEDQWLGGTVSVYNILGQQMIHEPVVLGESKYDISTASQGVYFLTLQNGERKKTLRFTKR